MNVSDPADTGDNDAQAHPRAKVQVSLLFHFAAKTHLMQNANLQQLQQLQAQQS